jgi:glycosyltransferase involved in cell wall biosynthesis
MTETARRLPVISIVTPSYNQGEFVEWTVRSVFLQRYPALEYILMDGGSKDRTLERLEPYRERFAHFVSAPDRGQADALRRGFERSTGEIMAYLNSDDVLLPGTLAYVADYFRRHPEVDMIYSHRCMIDERNTVTSYWILPPHCSALIRRWDLIPQETCFWRRRLFEREGNVDPSFRFAMDYDLFVRYLRSGRVRRVSRFLGAFRVHGDSKTETQWFSVGRGEVARVRAQYGIRCASDLLGSALSHAVQLRSAWFVYRGGTRPGLPPGVGYNLDEMWGGLLDNGEGAA